MSRLTFAIVVVVLASAAFGGDYLVIDCHTPYKAAQYASAADLPHGGLTNRIYAREYLVMRRIPAAGQTFRMGNERAEADAMSGNKSKRKREIGREIVGERSEKCERLAKRSGVSLRTALVYDGELAPSVEADGYIDSIVSARQLLGI